MMLHSVAASAALMSLVTPLTAHAADVHCWRPDEVRAARIQNLQTVLMVDAIKCQDTIPATLASYNAFVGKHRELLTANRYAVQAHFVRTLGAAEGATAATNHETRAGNQLSAGPIDVKRCEATGMYARLATHASEEDLAMMADVLATGTEIAACPVAAAPGKPVAMVIPIWKKPAPLSAATPTVATGPAVAPALAVAPPPAVAAASALATPGVMTPAVATAVKPLAMPAAKPPRIAAPAPPTPDHASTLVALQAAVAALNQVASTLQPAATPPKP